MLTADFDIMRRSDKDYYVIADGRKSGDVFRFRCRASSAIVKWVERRWERTKALASRYERCTCMERGERCPLCVEAGACTDPPP